MEDEKLIECVRQYEFLYNLQHPKYMDSIKKEMAWKDISEQIKQPAAACKQRWQGLRDAYRRAVNKKKGKSGQAAKNIKKWKYEEEMAFVASFFVERKCLESVELTSDDEESQQNNDAGIEIQNHHFDNEINNNAAIDIATAENITVSEIQNDDVILDCNKSSQPPLNQAKKAKTVKRAKIQPPQSASAVLMSKFLVSEMELQQLAPPNFVTTPQYAYSSSPASTSSSAQASASPMPQSPELWNANEWNDNN
ncbi:unnamed protein product [Euphydryas editha]|uniref:MADF domain-containing protein n=1 Tax=Euphydryas editha TaxID=104508 RepID=A0AAU9V7J8_EUPED|nr:unnamed protein product [Euphydryas editha]